MNLSRLRRKRDEGFTLIELLIVIVILGILSAVVVISVRGITSRGNKSACQSSRTAVTTATEAAFAQNGAYPANLAGFSGFLDSSNLTAANGAAGVVTFSGGNPAWTLTYTQVSSTSYTLPNTCPAT